MLTQSRLPQRPCLVYWLPLAVIAMLGLSTASASALVGEDCGAVLISTTIDASSSYEQKLALLQSIQTQEQQDKSRDAGLGITFPKIDFSATYSDFNVQRNSFLSDLHYNLDVKKSQRLVTSFLPENVTDRWADCVKMAAGGLVVYPKDVTKQGVTLVVHWDPPKNVLTVHLGNVQIIGSDISDQQLAEKLPKTWSSKATQTVSLKRNSDQELRVVINLGKESDSFKLDPWREEPRTPPTPPTSPESPLDFRACDPPSVDTTGWLHAVCGGNFRGCRKERRGT